MANKYIFLDLETTHCGGPDKDSPEAHWLSNSVVLCGASTKNTDVLVSPSVDDLCHFIMNILQLGQCPVLVAHNAKFDIKYLMRDMRQVPWHKVKVWDTMTWEYRYSGHTFKFSTLEDACARHGIPMKKSLDLGALIAKGVKVEDIDRDQLKAYLKDDVLAVKRLFEAQQAKCYECDMDYILPLAEMELNGLTIDVPKTQAMYTKLASEVLEIEETFCKKIQLECEWQDGSAIELEDFSDKLGTKSKYIKPLAGRTMSFLFTGTPNELSITPKWKVRFKGTPPVPPVFFQEYKPTNLGYPMDENVLSRLNHPLAEKALAYRKANKLLSTYVGPFLHTAQIQGTIHPKLNTTATGTGRLSSSKPNGQNIPPEGRNLCVPKLSNHKMVEIDFSQLEMVAVACVSGSKTMIQALMDGKDLHYLSGKKVMGWTDESQMTKNDRKLVKNVNFGVLYGGKATGLSHQTGVDKATIQKLIDSFYTTYPEVAKWQKKVFTDVVNSMEAYDIQRGEQRYASMYDEPFSGRRFHFIEQESPAWLRRRSGRRHSFSPQQTSNYPIQGFAGGDIVMGVLTHLWRDLDARFVMTVHDSILIETDAQRISELPKRMNKACKIIEQKFNLPVPLLYEIETGDSWQ